MVKKHYLKSFKDENQNKHILQEKKYKNKKN